MEFLLQFFKKKSSLYENFQGKCAETITFFITYTAKYNNQYSSSQSLLPKMSINEKI